MFVMNDKLKRNIELIVNKYGSSVRICQVNINDVIYNYIIGDKNNSKWQKAVDEALEDSPFEELGDIIDKAKLSFNGEIKTDRVCLSPCDWLDYDMAYHKESDTVFIRSILH